MGIALSVSLLFAVACPEITYPLPAGADRRIATPTLAHGNNCRGATYSRDGRMLATLSDRSVLVRSVPDGRRMHEFHFPRIARGQAILVFSPNDQQLLVGEADFSRLEVFDLRTGSETRLEVNRSEAERFEMSHATWVSDKLVRAVGEGLNEKFIKNGRFEVIEFDPTQSRPIARRPLPALPVALAADGTVAVLHENEKVQKYDLVTGKRLAEVVPVSTQTKTLRFDGLAQRVLLPGPKYDATVFDLQTGKELVRIESPIGLPDSIPDIQQPWIGYELSADGKEVMGYSGGQRQPFRQWRWRVKDGKLLAKFAHPPVWDFPLAGSGKGPLTVVGHDGFLRRFDRETGERIGPAIEPLTFAVSPDGRTLASGNGVDFRTHDIRSGKLLRTIRDEYAVGLLGVNNNGQRIVPVGETDVNSPDFVWKATINGDRLVLRSRTTGQELRSCQLPPNHPEEDGRVMQIRISPGGNRLAVVATDHIDVFDAELRHRRRFQVIPIRDQISRQLWSDIHQQVSGVALSPDGRWLAIGDYSGVRGLMLGTKFSIYEVDTGNLVTTIDSVPGLRTPLTFSPNGRHLWTEGNGVALRYDLLPPSLPVLNRQTLLTELRGESSALAYLAAGRLAAPGMLTWLGEQLPPDTEPDPALVAKLTVQLSDREFQTREKATAELVKLGPAAVQLLRNALKNQPLPEVRQRLETAIGRGSNPASPEVRLRLRAVAAVAMLADGSDTAARKLLQHWATGSKASPLTDAAQLAVKRLSK